MKIKAKAQKEVYWKCKKCGDEIYWNTHKKMVLCKCGALGVDGCEFYVRLIGDKEDREEIKNDPKRRPSAEHSGVSRERRLED